MGSQHLTLFFSVLLPLQISDLTLINKPRHDSVCLCENTCIGTDQPSRNVQLINAFVFHTDSTIPTLQRESPKLQACTTSSLCPTWSETTLKFIVDEGYFVKCK